jgi:DNA-directed RNA polymerase specialized sigma24 family protein
MALAVRIRDGRVDVTRPLHALARRTARNFFLDECRRQRRLTAIGSEQIERWGAGAGRPPEESAEALRQGEALRGGLIGLIERGKLNETDLLVLIRRYVDEWSADEVAGATGLGAENVRQICTRRRRLLRSEFADMELEETAG